jgi:D-glycero-alpha-D-manno-heptose 1-phosphate guanylyltransferase
MKQAIILAGGFGTRLRSVVQDVPKPMASVAGRPFLVYIMDYLQKNGFEKIVLAIGYKGDVIQNFFGNTYKNMAIDYAVEATPLGTGGGILNATRTCSDAPILVLNGDTFFEVPLDAFLNFHETQRADLSLALKPLLDFERYGTVELADNQQVSDFKEKKYCDKGLINGGVYWLQKDLFSKSGFEIGEAFSFEQDLLMRQRERLRLFGFVADAYFIDIGIPEDYEKAQQDFL